MSWVQGLFQDLSRDRPDDPWNYIDASTNRARTQSMGSSCTASTAAQPNDASSIKANQKATSACEVDQVDGVRTGKLLEVLKENRVNQSDPVSSSSVTEAAA